MFGVSVLWLLNFVIYQQYKNCALISSLLTRLENWKIPRTKSVKVSLFYLITKRSRIANVLPLSQRWVHLKAIMMFPVYHTVFHIMIKISPEKLRVCFKLNYICFFFKIYITFFSQEVQSLHLNTKHCTF